MSDEATSRRITAGFFREHPVSEPAERSARWLNQQGRPTEPTVKRPGSDHDEPIGWDAAFALLAEELAEISTTPTSKGVVVGLERTTTGATGATDTAPRSDGP